MRIVQACRYPVDMDMLKGVADGVLVHNYNLIKNLSINRDNIIYVITMGDTNQIIKEDEITIYVLKHVLPKLSTPLDALKIRNLIIKIDPEVVHAQESWFPYSTSLILLPTKYKRFLTVHGNPTYERNDLRKNGWRGYIGALLAILNEKFVIKYIHNIIIVSPTFRDHLKLDNSNVKVIPNGIDLNNNNIVNARSTSDFYTDILYCGRLEERKGPDIFINAISIVKKIYPDIRVALIGKGIMYESLQRLVIQKGLGENVKFLGFQSEYNKYSYIKSTKIGVIPSRYEPFGITVIEFMSCSKPVIGSDCGGIPYIIEDGKNGLLFKTGNYIDLSDKLIKLLKDTKLADMIGKNARDSVIEKYQWHIISETTLKFYKEINCNQ